MPHRTPYLIAYDISDTRTQTRVRRILQGYATGGQQSLFCCWLSDAEYRRALNNLEVLNSDGMTPFEERLYNPSKLREIKKSVEAIGNVQD